MTDTSPNKAPIEGTVEFIQHVLPGLEAGAYKLKVSQTLSTQTAPVENSYFFAVQGRRFQLDPSEVFSVYPPDLAVGEFDNTLPHAVLTTRTLPWQRYPTLAPPPRKYDDTHDRDVPTWLAVLVFDADDEAAHPGFSAQARAGSVRDLFIPRTGDAKQGYSYFYADKDVGPTSPDLGKYLDFGETPDDLCQILDVPLSLFWDMAPSVNDLQLMAHVRNVNILRKATQNGVPAGRNDLSAVPGTSDFALVMGSRIPQTGKRSFAHLVSLEGMQPFLPIDPATSDDGAEVSTPKQAPDPNGFPIQAGGFVRLVSLKSWSFTSDGDSSQFEQGLLALKPKTETPKTDFNIGLPQPAGVAASPAEALARNALAMGYTALLHQTRDGGRTVSWYRGPLAPYGVTTDVLSLPLSSADAATVYDPAQGLFDLGYAGAWQIGRLLAINDKRFSSVLCNWRVKNLRDAIASMEALVISQTLDAIQQQQRDHQLVYPLLAPFAPSAPSTAAPDAPSASLAPLFHARTSRADSHRAALADPAQLAAILPDDLATPFQIYDWLARLKLLEGVPFAYLVPDEAMLPSESIRFFSLDMNWIHALLDGALSVGRRGGAHTSPQATHDVAVAQTLRGQADDHARTVRATAMRMTVQPTAKPLEVVSGFILRSDVVKGWPGLEVNGYAEDDDLMDIVRFERLAPTVLLCLFEKDGKRLKKVDIHEPAEDLHFGLSGGASVNVRYNHASGAFGPGSQVKGVLQPAPFRIGKHGVVRMFRLAKDLLDPKFNTYITGVYPGFDHLPSSQFAMQMLRGVGLVSFVVGGSAS